MWWNILKILIGGKWTRGQWIQYDDKHIATSRMYRMDGKWYIIEVREIKSE